MTKRAKERILLDYNRLQWILMHKKKKRNRNKKQSIVINHNRL